MPPTRETDRPGLEEIRTAEAFRRWYWLKSELVAFARAQGLPSAGSKPELADRIAQWLESGEVRAPERRAVTSRFDWRREALTPETVITDSYRNTSNVRAFMKSHAGARFAFSNEFMAWMRMNTGRTLADAAAFWKELDRRKREDGYRERSLPQNQYARFSRALAEAKPGISAQEIRRLWKIKRSGPGPHEYVPGDELA